MIKVVLASASPRRRDLLSLIGISHTVLPADINEDTIEGESPVAYTERLSREKASAVKVSDALVIAADTTVVIDNDILGKPVDPSDAVKMISRLNGRTHRVVTAVACSLNGRLLSNVTQVSVTFRTLTEQEICEYVATGEPMDKAGAYGIQGYGSAIVERIDGDYFAVMGLPIVPMLKLFKELGVLYHFADGISPTAVDISDPKSQSFPEPAQQ